MDISFVASNLANTSVLRPPTGNTLTFGNKLKKKGRKTPTSKTSSTPHAQPSSPQAPAPKRRRRLFWSSIAALAVLPFLSAGHQPKSSSPASPNKASFPLVSRSLVAPPPPAEPLEQAKIVLDALPNGGVGITKFYKNVLTRTLNEPMPGTNGLIVSFENKRPEEVRFSIQPGFKRQLGMDMPEIELGEGDNMPNTPGRLERSTMGQWSIVIPPERGNEQFRLILPPDFVPPPEAQVEPLPQAPRPKKPDPPRFVDETTLA